MRKEKDSSEKAVIPMEQGGRRGLRQGLQELALEKSGKLFHFCQIQG